MLLSVKKGKADEQKWTTAVPGGKIYFAGRANIKGTLQCHMER